MSKIKYDTEQVRSVFETYPDVDKVLITSDGNVFLPSDEGYCKNHCLHLVPPAIFELLSKVEFEKGVPQTGAPAKSSASTPASADVDWKTLKPGKILEWAVAQGLSPTTKANKGAAAVIAEVETLLAAKQAVEKEAAADFESEESTENTESANGAPAGDPEEGTNLTTNHQG
jgi:hypothetical protein